MPYVDNFVTRNFKFNKTNTYLINSNTKITFNKKK